MLSVLSVARCPWPVLPAGRGRVFAVVLTATALLWLGVLIAAPLIAARVGTSPALGAVYSAAGLICHQRPARSFSIAGRQLPVCARCFGLYAAGAVAAVAAHFWADGRIRGGTRAVQFALALAAAPTASTVLLEWAGLAVPSNAGRAAAAVPLGAAAGWIFVRLLADDHPASVTEGCVGRSAP